MADTYFATKLAPEIGPALWAIIEDWDTSICRLPYFDRIRTAARMYCGVDDQGFSTYQVSMRGPSGNLVNLKVNHVRPTVQDVLTFVTGSRPTVKPVAKQTSADSQQATALAKNRYEHYMADHDLEAKLLQAAEWMIAMAQGWISGEWDEHAGSEVAVDEASGRAVREGDLRFSSHLPGDVIFDLSRRDNNHQWVIVRRWVNKHDEAAKHPTLAERIRSVQTPARLLRQRVDFTSDILARTTRMDPDVVPLYEFRHADTPAVPGGRVVKLMGPDLVLTMDPVDERGVAIDWTDLPYDDLGVYEMAHSHFPDTPWGYSNIFDVLGLQSGVDVLTSIPITNQATLGVQAVLVPEGRSFEVKHVAHGFPVIEYSPGPKGEVPQPVQWTQTAPEVFAFRDTLIQEIGRTGGGLSSVTQGTEDRKLSGAAQAMLDAISQRFNSKPQQAYAAVVRKAALFVIRTLARHVKQPRLAKMSGADGNVVAKEFTGQDLAAIDSVTVEAVGAMFQTTSGRLTVAETLMSKVDEFGRPLISPNQYLGVLETGKLEVATEAPESERLYIKRENEALARGEPCIVAPTDNHPRHIDEHSVVWNSPEVREAPQISDALQQHIMDHVQAWVTAPPAVLAARRIPPPPAPVLMPGPPPGPGSETPQPAAATAVTLPPEAAPTPNLPSPPTNPATGQPWQAQGGGL